MHYTYTSHGQRTKGPETGPMTSLSVLYIHSQCHYHTSTCTKMSYKQAIYKERNVFRQ